MFERRKQIKYEKKNKKKKKRDYSEYCVPNVFSNIRLFFLPLGVSTLRYTMAMYIIIIIIIIGASPRSRASVYARARARAFIIIKYYK